jgi:hypothetical protein
VRPCLEVRNGDSRRDYTIVFGSVKSAQPLPANPLAFSDLKHALAELTDAKEGLREQNGGSTQLR